MPKYVRVRRGYSGGNRYGNKPKRPIDKNMISIAQAVVVSGSSINYDPPTNLAPQGTGPGGMNFPGTFTGLKWSLSFLATNSTNAQNVAAPIPIGWAIIRLRQGVAIAGINLADHENFYTPEQDVLACGTVNTFSGSTTPVIVEGQTKTMRKLMAGDRVVFKIAAGLGAAVPNTSAVCNGSIQYFYKT